MSTDTSPSSPTPSSSGTQAEPRRVYVEIPRAKPGQGYHAPTIYRRPLLTFVQQVFTILLCASIPGAVTLIFAMILANDPNSRTEFLWIWVPLIIFVEALAIFLAIGVGREALGLSGVGKGEPVPGKPLTR